MPLEDRLAKLNQVAPERRRLVADLPPETQLNAINQILAGQRSTNPMVNDFVMNKAREGKTPEQIRQEFITEQRRSATPLIIMEG